MEAVKKEMSWTTRRRAGWYAMQERRAYNSVHYPLTGKLFLVLYPLFIVLMAELNQGKYPSRLVLFAAGHPLILLFDVLVSALIFCSALLIFRSSVLSCFLQSFLYMALSITELFKYATNGNHLVLTDMKIIRSIRSILSFSYIRITPRLLLYIAMCLLYIFAVYWFNPHYRWRPRIWKRLVPGLCGLAAVVVFITVPALSYPVYALFGVDTTRAANAFIEDDKFTNNGFLAFFMQTGTENFLNRVEEPEEYDPQDENTVSKYLASDVEEHDFESGVKPNVITIMSESFADFRVFEDKLNDLGYTNLDFFYASLDQAAQEGYRGTTVVPTYASYTVRTENELLLGLPMKSLGDPNMPQYTIANRLMPSIPSYYKSYGYTTTYLHPFLGSFYNRRRVYQRYSFDQMIFEDDFTVPITMHGNYFDDNTVYNQIEALIDSTDEPLYLHTTTMQNHQPYTDGSSDDEFRNYLQDIKHSADGLMDFLERLKDENEPTIVLFMGDHFPSLRGEDGIYAQMRITSENCSDLFKQGYVVWANYDVDFDAVFPEESEAVSTFYLPYLLMELIDAPRDSFTEAMMDEMTETPIYATSYDPDAPADTRLDTLTYDRLLGDLLTPSALPELYTEEEISQEMP